MAIKIRPLQQSDFPDWLPLWDGNNQGKRDKDVTSKTWSRIIDPQSSVNGFCAIRNDRIVGLVHYVLHPTTGNVNPVCYMQDLYVDPNIQKKGVGKALVHEVARTGRKEKWTRMYWIAESNNAAAQNLYKNFGVKLDFTLHMLPLCQGG